MFTLRLRDEGCISCHITDVTDLKAFTKTIDDVIASNGSIHHLVNVVGGAEVRGLESAKDYELEMFDRKHDT
ncbi:MAG: hypothetical protein Ct9H90mP30_6800 [Actinomycetota bacterium]|nr:MAG: hypothetical protein Ct9H90mP30_6800 [Actinomycetota bacterium]